MKAIEQVLIVGGGTAGWLTACFLARTLGSAAGGVKITLVESPEIGVIGVGEGTFPSIRGTLAAIGIDEGRFVRECHATFKQGIQFVDWVRPRGGVGPDHYFHPFSMPSQRRDSPELLPYWLLGGAGQGASFAGAVTMQKGVADAARGPKRTDEGDFLGALNYAYHFDAVRFAALLCEHGKSLGVSHVLANVERVELAADGAIAAVVTAEKGALHADLYIDCSGFRAALIGTALDSPFHAVDDTLFADRALAVQVPYATPDAPIPSYTIATAQEAGWVWDIGLHERRGTGYVYSSRHTDDTRAEQVLRHYLGAAGEGLATRQIRLKVGYRETPWVKNCVAVGLSGGFLEPLEASGIGLIETAAYLIGHLFPFDGDMAPVARHFNAFMTTRYERIVDFLKMHYCLTQRRDSAFWRDNADPASIPASLRDRLAMWASRPPHRLDFITDLEMYPPSSWQYVLYGMEFQTGLGAGRAALTRMDEARQEFRTIAELTPRARAALPSHRELVAFYCNRK